MKEKWDKKKCKKRRDAQRYKVENRRERESETDGDVKYRRGREGVKNSAREEETQREYVEWKEGRERDLFKIVQNKAQIGICLLGYGGGLIIVLSYYSPLVLIKLICYRKGEEELVGGGKQFLTKEATKQLVHALVISRIDFCNSLLYSLPDVHTNKL